MGNLSSILGGNWTPPTQKQPDPPEIQLHDAIRNAGLEPPEQIHLDGRLHRFKSGTTGKGGHGDKPGWYVAFPEGIPAGRFGCWRSGLESPWRADMGREYSAAEEMAFARRMAEAKAIRDAELERSQASAAATVEIIWEGCTPASADHPYLSRKGIAPHGSRVTGDGRLVVPLYSDDGELTSLQYIAHDGGKMYHSGGKTGGSFWMVGSLDTAGSIYVAEGFATAVTVHEATGRPCIVAYSASNLVPVTGSWRDRMGALQDIVVVADNDKSGTGQKYADQCAAKYGARIIMPPEEGDVNDYAAAGGDVALLLAPQAPANDWLMSADDFSSQPAPVKWILKGWLQEQSLIMMHGPSGGGKTFVLLEWLLSVAGGMTDWHGRRMKPGPVVYLAGEGHEGLRGRVAGWKAARQISSLMMWISRGGCDLNTAQGYQQAASEIKRLGIQPCIIAVDTLHRFLAGDENKAQDAKTMLDACAMLMREFGCSVVLVHHTGVSDEAQHRARGSSAWRGALEVEISVVPGKDGGPMEIVQRKSKDAELSVPIYAQLTTQEIPGWLDEDGEQVTTAIVQVTEGPTEAPASKKESKHQRYLKMYESAWWDFGAELKNGKPYVSRSAFKEYLMKAGICNSDASAQKYVQPSNTGKPISDLLLFGSISEFEHGWVLEDKVTASVLLMRINTF